MKPETHLKFVVAGITPLANFLQNFKPACKRIHIRRADHTLLRDEPAIARTFGFVIDGEHVSFKGFELLATDCGTHHGKDR